MGSPPKVTDVEIKSAFRVGLSWAIDLRAEPSNLKFPSLINT